MIEKGREIIKERIDLLLSLRAVLLLKSDYTKAGIASKHKEEKDTLESIGKILFHVSKNSNLLQKR